MHADQQLDIKQVTFRVDEYYKGEGSAEVTIMVDTTGGALVSLDVGTPYVLYLFEGGEFWDQGYLVQALQQGVWVVDGDNATRQVGEVKTVPLSHFSEPPEATPNPPPARDCSPKQSKGLSSIDTDVKRKINRTHGRALVPKRKEGNTHWWAGRGAPTCDVPSP